MHNNVLRPHIPNRDSSDNGSASSEGEDEGVTTYSPSLVALPTPRCFGKCFQKKTPRVFCHISSIFFHSPFHLCSTLTRVLSSLNIATIVTPQLHCKS